MCVNGMLNSKVEADKNFQYLSDLGGGIKIDTLYNASHGPLDIVEALFQTKMGYYSPPSKLLANRFMKFAYENPPDARLLAFSFSQGTVETRHALELCSHDVRSRIISVAFGSSDIIPRSFAAESYNYVSRGDFISLLADPTGLIIHRDSVYHLDVHPDACWYFDHDFKSPTYSKVLQGHIEKYIETYRKG